MLKWQRGGAQARRGRWLIPLAVVVAALVLLWLLFRSVGSWFQAPDPTTIAQASLQSMREQQRLIVFSSGLTATQTTTQRRGPFSYSRTLIMPGNVRYELDLAKLSEQDVRWDAASNTLAVTLPPIELSDPQIDLNAIREIGDGGVLRGLMVNDEALDQANRQAGLQQLKEQASQPLPMRLARENAKRAIARNFALPMRAAGIEANVEVRFADEPRQQPGYIDHSTSLNEVMGRPVDLQKAR